MIYIKNHPCLVSGFIVPREFIQGVTLANLERILGFRAGRFDQGAVFAQLDAVPSLNELEYFGDTRTAAHNFDKNRTKSMSKEALSAAAYSYFRSASQLIKVIPFKDANRALSDDDNWPAGHGAMQWKLKNGISKPARVIDIIYTYPSGRF